MFILFNTLSISILDIIINIVLSKIYSIIITSTEGRGKGIF